MKATVIYHRADFDGIFCREIAKKFLPPETTFIGRDFGDPPLAIPESGEVIVMDLPVDRTFGFDFVNPITLLEKFGDVEAMKRFDARLTWIDHHKSSIETHPKEIKGCRIDGVAACRLAWQWFRILQHDVSDSFGTDYIHYFERRVREPLAVRLAGEYDIWDKRDSRADTLQFGLRSIDLEMHWSSLLSLSSKPSIAEIESLMDIGYQPNLEPDGTSQPAILYTLLANGEIIQRYQRERDASVSKRAFNVGFEGLYFLALNTAMCNSLTFESAATVQHDGLMGFYFDGEQWRVSLYHSPHHKEHDLSAIAVKFGGGGHRGACGFRVPNLPFLTRYIPTAEEEARMHE